jgi:site-specific DNA recombinase
MYLRVSSDDQEKRGTIATQRDVLKRRIALTSGIEVVGWFEDEGVSGTIPFADRPGGRELMALAEASSVDQIWVLKVDRLGRDAVDLLILRRRFDPLGVRIVSMEEGEQQALPYDINAVISDYARETFLRLTAHGIDRAAREGRYLGGPAPYGYRVEGKKKDAHLVPDDQIVVGERTAVDVIRHIYGRIAIDDWSTDRVADELNALGVPTQRQLEKGTRRKRTQGVWRGGRIRNMVVNTIYKGERRFGQRTKKEREIISARVPALVSDELWQATQNALARHRICARNTRRDYLLKSVIVCGHCGHHYVGSQSNGKTWYRCNAKLKMRDANGDRCIARQVKGALLEPVVWQDIEQFLRHPGDLLAELDGRHEREAEAARIEAEISTITRRLDGLARERREMLRQRGRGRMTDDELDEELRRIDADREALELRLAGLAPPPAADEPDADLLERLRQILDQGLTAQQRQEIVRLLVGKIVVTTTVNDDGTKDLKASISYRFPNVAQTFTGRGSWRR